MSNVPSVASTSAAYAGEAPALPERPARAAAANKAAAVSESLRDRLDPNMRVAETYVNDGQNPTVVRYLTIEARRRRDHDNKPAFKRFISSFKRKAPERRAMDKLMRSEAALKDELRTLNQFIEKSWARAQECYKVGDASGARVHSRQVLEQSRQADRVKVELKSVQGIEEQVVEQLSSTRLMGAHQKALQALKTTPDGANALQERLEVLEKVKDRAADNIDQLRDNLEMPADDEDAAMQVLMDKLGQTSQAGLETAPPVQVQPDEAEALHPNDNDWEPLYS